MSQYKLVKRIVGDDFLLKIESDFFFDKRIAFKMTISGNSLLNMAVKVLKAILYVTAMIQATEYKNFQN